MAKLSKEQIAANEKEREDRMRLWSDARNEGIREGFLMAIAALEASNPSNAVIALPSHETVIARGNRHFGDSEWQTKRR